MGVINTMNRFRGRQVRTYHVVGALEFIILCLWIPPTYFLAKHVQNPPAGQSVGVTVSLIVLLAVNM